MRAIQISISAVALALALPTAQGEAQFAVARGLAAPRVKQIWSRNKNFVADVFFDQNITTIGKVEWQGNIGRTTPFWSMEGAVSSGWLADDGVHFVAGLEAPTAVPRDYTGEPTVLSFFSHGRLTRQIRLGNLMTDSRNLQIEGPSYRWAKYIELNACGYLAVETVENQKFLFDVTRGERVELSAPTTYRVTGWNAYQDRSRCYQFQFPGDYAIKETMDIRGIPAGCC